MEQLAAPLTQRYGASLASYVDQFIFVIGGYGQNSVDYYSIEKDEWASAPPMANNRYLHSSCTLGSVLYVFGGIDDFSYFEN